jgi:hypothetical protein
MTDLQKHRLYRIAFNTDDKRIAGQPCIFLDWRQENGYDIRRAVVNVGHPPVEYLVNAAIIIP